MINVTAFDWRFCKFEVVASEYCPPGVVLAVHGDGHIDVLCGNDKAKEAVEAHMKERFHKVAVVATVF